MGQRINTRLRAGGNAGGIAFDFRAGALDPRITFTRASAAWYFDHNGNLIQAATNEPRFDYAPSARIQTYSYTIPDGDSVNNFIVPVGINGIISQTVFVNGAPITPTSKISSPFNPLAETWFGLPTTYFGGTVLSIEYTGFDPVGLLIEGASTNIALHSRDFTQSAWVKTNITAALNVTGIDGVADSASRLTATAGNATALQTITSASATHVSSFFARRITGTGTVEITQDNGATWTAITLTSAWQRFNVASATVLNPVIGFRIVTSGNVIAVDVAQCEVSAVVSSPIITGAASVARAADNATVNTLTPWFNPIEGTILAEYSRPFPASGQHELSFNDGTIAEALSLNNASVSRIVNVSDNSVTQFLATVGAGFDAAFQVSKKALAYRAADFAGCLNGGTVSTGATGAIPTVTSLRIGRYVNTFHANGWIRRIAYYPTRLPNATLQGLTA